MPLTRRDTLRTATLATATLAGAAAGLPAPGSAEAATGDQDEPDPAPVRAAAAPPDAAVADRPLFGARLWRLPNGLRVAFVESRRAPVVAQYLFYGAGAGEDPAGRSGTAHFLEHMMFKGSRRVAPGALSIAVAREGGSDNAFTSRDVTGYHQHVEASRFRQVAMMESDRLEAPLLPADTLEAERQVILEERRLRTDSNPRARFREAFTAALWGRQHWHGRPIIGWEEEIRAITRDDLAQFHAARYAPGNAVLAIGGDLREEEARRIIEDEYGGVPVRAAQGRDRAPAPGPAADFPRLVSRERGVREAAFARAWVAPSLTAAVPAASGTLDPEHAYPLEVLARLLGGGTGSRLYRALVETGLVVAVGASYDSDTVGAGEFNVAATPSRDTAPEKLEDAVAAAIDRVLQDGATEAEVERAKRQITAGALLALDSLGAAPRMIGDTLASGMAIDTVEHWPAHVRAVTTEQVNAAARALLGGRVQQASGWLLPPDAETPRPGQAQGQPT